MGPGVQEEGGVGAGVQERGGRGREPGAPEELEAARAWGSPGRGRDWGCPPPWPGGVQEVGLGPRKQHQEEGGGSPAVQERGEARSGVQERGEERLRGSEPGGRSWAPRERRPGSREEPEDRDPPWESRGHPRREAVVLGAVGRAWPAGPRGLSGEGRPGVQEANWLPGVQEGQVAWAVQETYLAGKGPQGIPEEGSGVPASRQRRRRRRRRW